ncbi:T3SS effector HopA1 family protein [Serinicoccus kebangsaanensis]|uniref:T3SS effector HopA1 family protein n=1 Tax=Serinicoccus kebangsaanensis TaxID=2602069 RepID=UPI00178C3D63|nr:T3SS effector HopA1 family protein [Serinicoccus kebangsaanensis]
MTGVAAALSGAVRVAAGTCPDDLADELYSSWYAAPVAAEPAPASGPPLPGLLSAAALRVAAWSPATVRQVDPAGGAVVRLACGGHRAVLPGTWTRSADDPRAGLPMEPGDEVLVADVGGPVTAQGWWRSWSASPAWPHPVPREPLTRIYACVTPHRAVEAVERAVTTLVPLPVPWMLKCAVTDAGFTRPDRLVVYLPDDGATAALAGLADATAGLLDPHQPPLAAPWSPGLSWAQDDGDGASFGENRCAALAAALGPWRRGGSGDGLEAAREGLRQAGIDDRLPHLRRRTASPA